MKGTSIDFIWIVVKDLRKSIDFYTHVVGLELKECNEEYGWAELQGAHGIRMGIASQKEGMPIQSGGNTVTTITVENLEKAKEEMEQKNVRLVGDVQEIPGHVKMQLCQDLDGNHFQLVEVLSESI